MNRIFLAGSIYDQENETRSMRAARGLLDRLENRGLAKTVCYACEGTPEQCRANPNCLLFVAACTGPQSGQLQRWADECEVITLEQTADDPHWNGAIFYCGRACELPAVTADSQSD